MITLLLNYEAAPKSKSASPKQANTLGFEFILLCLRPLYKLVSFAT